MLSSAFAYYQFCDVVSGAVVKNLNSKKVASALFPLPPITEQRRIVLAVEKVEQHLENYNVIESELTLLNTVFPDRLKKSILQMAVQGKLVPQDPADEPAEILLERIRAERQQLIKEGKIKKDKYKSVIYRRDNSHYEKLDGIERCIDDEIPFEIPENWAWCRIGNLVSVKGGKRVPKGVQLLETPTSHMYIRVTDMKNHTLVPDKVRYISDNVFQQISSYTISKDDLYLTIAGTIGNVGIVPEEFDGMNLTENAVKLTNIQIDKSYLLHLICSPMIQEQFIDKTNRVAQPKLAIERIAMTLTPVPPISEQRKIVVSLGKIIRLIDAL